MDACGRKTNPYRPWVQVYAGFWIYTSENTSSRCLLSGSCPQLLDAALLPSQQPVDVEPIGVGCYLCHDPGRKPYQGLGKRAFDPEDPLENGERYLCLLPHSVLAGALCNQRDSGASQRLTQLFASVGQVAKQPPGRSFPEPCTTEQFAGQSDLREVGRGQLVGEGHTVGRAQEVKLHSVEGERSPPNPCCSLKPSRLLYLARMQYLKERGVYKEGLGLSDQLGDDLFPQGLKEAPELPHPPMQRGGVHPHYPREEVDEETLQVAQEGTFALHTPKLLEERQGYDFRVRELLERLVAVGGGVEQRVNVIHQAEQDRDRLFQRGEGGSMLSVSHPRFLSLGGSDGSCFTVKPRNRHLGVRGPPTCTRDGRATAATRSAATPPTTTPATGSTPLAQLTAGFSEHDLSRMMHICGLDEAAGSESLG